MTDFPTHLIAASMTLQYLANPASTQHSVLWLKCCLVVAECARSMIAASHELRSWVRQEFEQLQQQQQEEEEVTQPQPQQKQQQEGVTQPQQQQAEVTQPQQKERPYAQVVPEQWLGLSLPAVPKVMLQLAEHLARRDWPADTGSGADGPAAGPASNSSSSSEVAAAARLVGADDADPPEVLGDPIHHSTLLACFSRFLSLVSCMGEHSIAVPHSNAAGDVTLSFQGRDAWLGNAPALLAALEAFVRAAAATNASAEGIFSAKIAGVIRDVVQLCGGGDTPTVLLSCALFTPHGSNVRQQVMPLFSSVLKVVASLQVSQDSIEAKISSYTGFLDAAPWLMALPNFEGSCAIGETSDTAGEQKATAATAPASSTAADPRHIQCCMYGFNLLGRCCWGFTQLGRALIAFSNAAGDAPAQAATGQDGEPVPGRQGNSRCSAAIMLGSKVGSYAGRFNRVLLEEDDTNGFMQWLSCKGYDDTGLQQLLQQTGTALWGMRHDDPACSAEDAMQLLQQLGDAASSLAFARVCNNPGCVNLSGPSETVLVSGRSCMCAACRVAHYCCRQCQKSHWKQHKPVCKALVAATAAS